jgi:hypothetical protein
METLLRLLAVQVPASQFQTRSATSSELSWL